MQHTNGFDSYRAHGFISIDLEGFFMYLFWETKCISLKIMLNVNIYNLFIYAKTNGKSCIYFININAIEHSVPIEWNFSSIIILYNYNLWYLFLFSLSLSFFLIFYVGFSFHFTDQISIQLVRICTISTNRVPKLHRTNPESKLYPHAIQINIHKTPKTHTLTPCE